MTKRVKQILISRKAHASCGPKPFALSYRQVRYWWDKVKAHISLGEDNQLVIHALRHTFASRLVQKGVTIPVVQQLLGHKTIHMTMRYAHLCPSQGQEAIKVLEQ